MANRIIINNRTELSDEDAMLKVLHVIKGGRISNEGKQYCYLTSFGNKYHVATDLVRKRPSGKNSDSFIIYEAPITQNLKQ